MDFDAGWAGSARQIQQKLSESWMQALEAFRQAGGSAAPDAGAAQARPAITFSPDKLASLQQQYVKEASELWSQALQPTTMKDRRFSAPHGPKAPWRPSPPRPTCSMPAP